MPVFPQVYDATADANPGGRVLLYSPRLESFASDAPVEFGGPGDLWSPETLFVAAIADCFVLTFRAVAKSAALEWRALSCSGSGVLDRTPDGPQFTSVTLRARLTIPAGTDTDKVHRLLERAERACLISRSIKSTIRLLIEVTVEDAAGIGVAHPAPATVGP